ncbi:MAG TPA: hemolysin family protein [Streptosporangiaceae bacterium]|nr:hemolysin family protein [Streptosporangiaceae bacterium]
MAWLLVAALALVLLAGWCTSAETALLRVSRAGAKELGRSAGESAEPLQAALADVPRYLSVVLLIRVASEICAAVLVAAVLVTWLGINWKAFLITAAAMTLASFVLAGVIPRSIGRRSPVKVASAAATVLRPVIRLLGPLPRLLAAAGTAFPAGQGRRDSGSQSGAEEDLRGLVDLLEQRQIIEAGERAMIHSVFELGDTIVREVMVPRTDMVFVERGKTLGQLLSLALRSGFSRIPVIGENLDDVVGIAYLKDVMTRIHEHPEGEKVETVESIMRTATFAPDSKPCDDLLREMQARHVHIAIVIDEYGGTAGLVTIEDILEEIVGEIADEYDRERPPVEWLSDGSARVSARLAVEELEELFGVSIEAEDVETVGGLLGHALGKVPIAGSVATVSGLRLTAENLTGRRNRIGTVLVQRTEDGELAGTPSAGRPAPAESGGNGSDGAAKAGNGVASARQPSE